MRRTEDVTWLPIAGYQGIYEVSDRGQVRSLDRIVEQPGRWGGRIQRQLRGCVLKPTITGKYLTVGLRRDGQHETRAVHRLVLEAFAGPCPGGMEALHGRAGRHDNRWPENLCWGTPVQNAGDKRRDGTVHIGTRNGSAKLTPDKVREIRVRYSSGAISMQALGAEFGVGAMTVWKILTGKTWQHVA